MAVNKIINASVQIKVQFISQTPSAKRLYADYDFNTIPKMSLECRYIKNQTNDYHPVILLSFFCEVWVLLM